MKKKKYSRCSSAIYKCAKFQHDWAIGLGLPLGCLKVLGQTHTLSDCSSTEVENRYFNFKGLVCMISMS